MRTVAETSIFQRRAAALLTEKEYSDLIEFLAGNPEAGAEIVGTGGVRKMRFAAGGKGKSGGVRVIYYYYSEDAPLFRRRPALRLDDLRQERKGRSFRCRQESRFSAGRSHQESGEAEKVEEEYRR